MSTSVIGDSVAITPGPDNGPVGPVTTVVYGPIEVECDCCGLTEECTISYIDTIKERYGGKWICGLCEEAIKDEILRCRKLIISPDEALARHFNFCSQFRASGPPLDPTVHLIRAIKQILRRSFESPKFARSTPSSPSDQRRDLDLRGEVLAESCMSSFV